MESDVNSMLFSKKEVHDFSVVTQKVFECSQVQEPLVVNERVGQKLHTLTSYCNSI